MESETFGSLVRAKRLEKGLSLRYVASQLGYSATFWSDVENQRRNPPDLEKLNKIALILELSDGDREELYDLAGKAENITPPDLTPYILETQSARRALRKAKEKATDADWDSFSKMLDRKR